MSCIHHLDSDEPEFEPVTLQHPAVMNTIASATRMFIPTANSSPKLRLNLDDNDSLMTDADFDGILNTRNGNNQLTSQDQLHSEYDEGTDGDVESVQTHQRSSPPLPPPAHAHTATGTAQGDSKLEVPLDLQRQLSHLGIGTQFRDRNAVDHVSTGSNAGQAGMNTQIKRRPIPRPISILPRDGTVTALPGSTMKTAADEEGRDGDGISPTPSTTASTTTTNTSVSVSASTTIMPPPPLPATPTPASKHYSRPFRPATPMSMPATSSTSSHGQGQNQQSNHTKKRKLSLNAPILQNFKRILTPSNAGKRSGLNIMHLTHEETAGNRGAGGSAGSVAGKESGRDTPVQGHNGGIVERMATPTPASTLTPTSKQRREYSGTEPQSRPNTPVPISPASQTIRHMSSIKRSIMHPFKSHHRSATSDSTNTAATLASTSTTTNNNLDFTGDPASSSSHPVDPTSRSALNKLIIRLRSQISDLTLENRVLKDQVAIVRKDWIDTAKELDIERHRLWEAEMEAFRNGIRLEEMRAEVIRLKRGSMVE